MAWLGLSLGVRLLVAGGADPMVQNKVRRMELDWREPGLMVDRVGLYLGLNRVNYEG